MTIVVTVTESNDTPEEAARLLAESESRYEGFSHSYAAESLDTLPHPQQVAEVSEHFGT
jgi:hypothetical protein